MTSISLAHSFIAAAEGLAWVAVTMFGGHVLIRVFSLSTSRRSFSFSVCLLTVTFLAIYVLGRSPVGHFLSAHVMPLANMCAVSITIIDNARVKATAAGTPAHALVLPPGMHLRRVLAFFLTPQVVVHIVDPVLADLHVEWTEAVAAGRTRLWPIRLRAYLYVLQHLAYAAWRAFKD